MRTEGAKAPAVPTSVVERNGGSLAASEESASLSLQQKRLWSAQVGCESFSSQFLGRVAGRLDPGLLRECLCRVARNYEILHTIFYQGQKGACSKLALGHESVNWTESELSGLLLDERDYKVHSRPSQSETDTSGDSGVLRVSLLKLAENNHHVVLRAPAMSCDSVSLENLWNKAAWCYTHATEPVADEVLQYSDYVRWQRDMLAEQASLGLSVPWPKELRDPAEEVQSQASTVTGRNGPYVGSCLEFSVPERIMQRLKEADGLEQVSMEKMLLSCWLGFLCLYRNSSNLHVGVSIDGRPTEELQNAIGLFELYVQHGIAIQPTDSLLGIFNSAEKVLSSVRRCRYAVTWEDPAIAGAAQFPEFGFAWAECSSSRPKDGIMFFSLARHSHIARFVLALHGCRSEGALSCALQFDSSRIQPAAVVELQLGFIRFIEEITGHPDRSLERMESVKNAQRQILLKWNATTHDYPSRQCLHELFEEQVEQTPKAIAVRQGDLTLSYDELNRRANQVAHELREMGVRPETLVGICLRRSPEMVIGVLGILKAGGTYVPIDPHLPLARIALLLQDTGVSILLTDSQLTAILPTETSLVLCLDEAQSSFSTQETHNPVSQTIPENAAYVLYTSGSTGDPKGVVIPHAGIVNYLHWCRNAYAISDGQGAPVQSSLSFDLTLTSLFGPLLSGRAVVLLDEKDALAGLVTALSPTADFSLLKITPAHMTILNHRLNQKLSSRAPVRVVVVGGEALSAETVSRWQEKFPITTLVNEYGPTETVVGCCSYFIGAGKRVNGTVPIGRPIANTSLYVLDEQGWPIVDDTPGELYVGGAGVARGYLNRPGLTAEKFLPDPYSAVAGSRMYRTGDIAFHSGNGELEYVGRLDRQVKVRGFRVELGEIEAALRRSRSVLECAVEATTTPSGETALTAWVVPNGGERNAALVLRAFLEEHLPEYMVPSSFVIVGALPLTPNGKVDRNALLEHRKQEAAEALVPPRNDTELKILEVWEEVMQMRPISVTENFFAIGGNSMLAVRIISRLEKMLNKELPIDLLFTHKSIEDLAVAVGHSLPPVKASSLIRIQSGSLGPPLFLVHPMGGGVFGYVHLARHLGKDQPVYGLQSSGLHQGSSSRSIEQMAAQYIDTITEVDPNGPYLLGGWSMGGVLAFEMAQQLTAKGRKISLLFLIDSHPRPVLTPADATNTTESILREIVDQFREIYGERFQWQDGQSELSWDQQIPRLLEQMMRLHILPADADEATLKRILDVQAAHAEALAAYVPKQYPGKLVLFRSAESGPGGSSQEGDTSLGWQAYSPLPIETYFSPGKHDEMISEPHVSVLAQQLKSLLDVSHYIRNM